MTLSLIFKKYQVLTKLKTINLKIKILYSWKMTKNTECIIIYLITLVKKDVLLLI